MSTSNLKELYAARKERIFNDFFGEGNYKCILK